MISKIKTLLLEEIKTSLDGIDLYELYREMPYSFILDSTLLDHHRGRFSFMGGDPFLIFKSKNNKIEIIKDGQTTTYKGDPFNELRALMLQYRIDPDLKSNDQEPIIPFRGGAIGYFGYEMRTLIENLPSTGIDDLNLPDCYFVFMDSVMIIDHISKKKYYSKIIREEFSQNIDQMFKQEINKIKNKINALMENPYHSKMALPSFNEIKKEVFSPEIKPVISKEDYLKKILLAKNFISRGDVYEICLSQRFNQTFSGNPYQLFKELRKINPAPFSCFINFPEVKIISSSPERFLKLDGHRWAESRPIKGTRPRGQNPLHDRKLYNELLSSPKDQAENMMIVDLVRNDFGKLCLPYSIKVTELMKIEKYSTVYQMVSNIIGRLKKEYDSFDLIKACFPGGSMTGTPKIRAMEIIDQLEPIQRGIYSGSIGYLDFSGPFDLNIVIRTIFIKGKESFFNVGGAIVADSDPEEEFQETIDKALALRMALQRVGSYQ